MKTRPVAFALAIAALAGCKMRLAQYTGYRGDGTFTPQPAPSALCRDGYTVDLGAVDLTTAGSVTRVLAGLPPIEARIGLALRRKAQPTATDGEVVAAERPAAGIELAVHDAQGRLVLARRESLTQWIALHALDDADHVFLYQRGSEAEIAVAPGFVRVERFPIGMDDSWGTAFTPRRGAHYTVHFAVEQPDTEWRDIEARLQVRAAVDCP